MSDTAGTEFSSDSETPEPTSPGRPASRTEPPEIELDGSGASIEEHERAESTLSLLEQLAAGLGERPEAAGLLADASAVSRGLDDLPAALELARAAFRLDRTALSVVRTYRLVALRARAGADLLAALEAEAELLGGVERAALLWQRGERLLAQGHEPAARASWHAALEADPGHLPTLERLEHLHEDQGELARAGELAGRAAAAVIDPALKAEHSARAARLLGAAGDTPRAQEHAAMAQAYDPSAPAVQVAAEQLATGARALCRLREEQIARGVVDPGAASLEIALQARYVLGDHTLARRALARAAESTSLDAGSMDAVLVELAALVERDGDWAGLVALSTRRAELATSPAARAVAWHRIGRILEERLGDGDGALGAYERALTHDQTHGPLLEALGRHYQKRGMRDALIRMHLLEAEAAPTQLERAHALRRAGELRLEDPEQLDAGIEALRAAHKALPGHLGALAALELGLSRRGLWSDLLAVLEEEALEERDAGRRGRLLSRAASVAADRLGDRQRAINILCEAARLVDQGPHEVLSRLAQLYEDTGQLKALTQVLVRLAEREQDPAAVASLWERIAQTNEQLGDGAAAADAYRRALAVAPPSHPVFAVAGRAFQREGLFAEMAGLYERAAAASPPADRAGWLVRRATIQWQALADAGAAIDTLGRALELAEGHVAARELLAELLAAQERWEELRPTLTHPAASQRGDTLLRRAVLAERADDELEAMTLYLRAARAGVTAAYLSYARLLGRHGQHDDLLRLYDDPAIAEALWPAPHPTYRAALVAAEDTREHGRAAELLRRVLADDPRCAGALVLLTRVESGTGSWLTLADRVADPAARGAALLAAVERSDVAGELDTLSTIAERLRPLAARDPVAATFVEVALEHRRDRQGLATFLGEQAGRATPASGLRSWLETRRAAALEELGLLREAADVLEHVVAGERAPISAWVALERILDGLGDDAALGRARHGFARALPAGPAKARLLFDLGIGLQEDGRAAEALEALEAALVAEPGHDGALAAACALAERLGQPERAIDHLLRRFAATREPAPLVTLGVRLARRLVEAGRLDPARETLSRVLATEPRNLAALLLSVELAELGGDAEDIALALAKIAAHADAAPALRVSAAARSIMLRIAADDLLEAPAVLASLGPDDAAAPAIQRALAALAARRGDAGAEAAALAALTQAAAAAPGHDAAATARDLLRLAELQADALADSDAALATLARVTHEPLAAVALQRALGLGAGSPAARAACLAALVPRLGRLSPTARAELHARIARIHDEELGDGAGALPHLEQVVALDPDDVSTLERLAELAVAGRPHEAASYHRRLLDAEPLRWSSLRALRKLSLATNDIDLAFCVEAILVGLGRADEEEAYFHQQRRTRLGPGTGTLAAADLDRLFPEHAEPAVALLAALAPELPTLFPVDLDGYTAAECPPTSHLAGAAKRAGALLGVSDFDLALVPARLGPSVEPGAPPSLMLPRSLEEAPRREQLHVLGEAMARLRFQGVLVDPRRLSPATPALLERLLWAVVERCDPARVAPIAKGAVYEDLRQRLTRLVPDARVAELAPLAAAWADGATPEALALLHTAHARAALRVGVLVAQDPAASLARLRSDTKAVEMVARFALSETHLELRKRLGLGVEP